MLRTPCRSPRSRARRRRCRRSTTPRTARTPRRSRRSRRPTVIAASSIDLMLGDKPVRLPPRLAQLVLELADSPCDRSAVGRAVGTTQFLFPGRVPGRPAHATSFANKLNRHDIKITAVRNTARITLAPDLPAAVLADLSDMHINTAVRWLQRSKRDWSSYITTRAEDLNHKGSPQRWSR